MIIVVTAGPYVVRNPVFGMACSVVERYIGGLRSQRNGRRPHGPPVDLATASTGVRLF
jgi:hypothetical protein